MFKVTAHYPVPDGSHPDFQEDVTKVWRKIAEMVDAGKTDGARQQSSSDGINTVIRTFIDNAAAQEFVDFLNANPFRHGWAHTETLIEETT